MDSTRSVPILQPLPRRRLQRQRAGVSEDEEELEVRILAGDIGGTNARLAYFDVIDGKPEVLTESTLPSREYKTLEAALRQFKGSTGLRCDRACFGVPGPVRQGRARITNLPWEVDAAHLSKVIDHNPVWVINDLEANAYGVTTLGEGDFAVLNEGEGRPDGNAAIIAPGTGLGEAGLFWDGERHRPFATEGGHTDFAPGRDIEMALLSFLSERHEHVSWERVVSGPGLVSIYEFMSETLQEESPSWLTEQMERGDPAAAISEAAQSGRCPVCSQALDLFVHCFGAEAGNLALKLMARGGVYLGGGIAPKILDRLRRPAFMEAFTAKGRMSSLVRSMPVKVVLSDTTALRGAAYYAATA
jgi:glucokinase